MLFNMLKSMFQQAFLKRKGGSWFPVVSKSRKTQKIPARLLNCFGSAQCACREAMPNRSFGSQRVKRQRDCLWESQDNIPKHIVLVYENELLIKEESWRFQCENNCFPFGGEKKSFVFSRIHCMCILISVYEIFGCLDAS